MSSKAELKLLHRRLKRLHDYLDSVRSALMHASGAEIHVAVSMSTRVMNMIMSTFDVGVVDGVATYDINSRVVRLRRDDRDEALVIKQRLVAVYDQMITHLSTRTNEVAKAIS